MVRKQFIVVVAGLLGAHAASAGSLSGRYASPMGPLQVVETADGAVTGKLADMSNPCGLPKGTTVLTGARLDDSLAGSFKACKVGPECVGYLDGDAMLLITRGGAVLSGAVHFDGACKSNLSGDALVLRRAVPRIIKPGKAVPTAVATAVAGAGTTTSGTTTSGTTTSGTTTSGTTTSGTTTSGTTAGGTTTGGTTTSGTTAGGTTAGGTTTSASEMVSAAADVPEVEPLKPGDRNKAKALAREAEAFIKSGEAEQARAKLLEAVQADPTYAQGYVGVGVTYVLRDRFDEALEFYQKALEANPSSPDAYYNMACIHAIRGKLGDEVKQDEIDQSLNFLRIAILNGYVQLDHLSQDPDLKNLQGNERFEKMKRGELD